MQGEGTLSETAAGPRLTFTRRLVHPVDRVWSALSEPDQLAAWFARFSAPPTTGAEVDIYFHHADVHSSGRIVSCEPPHRLEWIWSADGEPDSHVEFRLEADGSGTLLTLIHTFEPRNMVHDYASVWHWHLDGLARVLDGDGFDFPVAEAAALAERYRERLGLQRTG